MAFLMNIARHNADFAFSGCDDSGAIGSDESRLFAFEMMLHARHIQNWDSFGDTNDEFDSGIRGFDNRGSRILRRNINN